MKILILYQKPEPIQPLENAQPWLNAGGVRVDFQRTTDYASYLDAHHSPYDLFVLQRCKFEERHLLSGRPIVIFDRIDGAQLGKSWFLRHNNVLGVIKHYRLRPIELQNVTSLPYHLKLLADQGIVGQGQSPRSPKPPLTLRELAKVQIIHGLSAWNKHQDPAHFTLRDHDSPRKYDVHLVCTVDYQGRSVEIHRKLAMDAVKKWKEQYRGSVFCFPGRDLPRKDYLISMSVSMATVSPWGFGEACQRDYEAFHTGSILIKPCSDHVDSHLDFYRSGKTYLPCKPDFSDLPAILTELRDNWKAYEPMRRYCKDLAMQAIKGEEVARAFLAALRNCGAFVG